MAKPSQVPDATMSTFRPFLRRRSRAYKPKVRQSLGVSGSVTKFQLYGVSIIAEEAVSQEVTSIPRCGIIAACLLRRSDPGRFPTTHKDPCSWRLKVSWIADARVSAVSVVASGSQVTSDTQGSWRPGVGGSIVRS
jgi:hypothetical protein